jgi:hypothetical protein
MASLLEEKAQELCAAAEEYLGLPEWRKEETERLQRAVDDFNFAVFIQFEEVAKGNGAP